MSGEFPGSGKHRPLLLRAAVVLIVAASSMQAPMLIAQAASPQKGWVLTWSDEFNSQDGSAPDPSKWGFDIGGNGWGNNELEYYTARRENSQIRNGNLEITARREEYIGTDFIRRGYTSGRLKSKGKFAQRYGRFEARMKIPSGKGMWPAFWMMGDDFDTVGWPSCGEIDVMENVGNEPFTVHGTFHGPGYSGNDGPTAEYAAPGAKLADDYHIYAVEWEPAQIRFYLDDHLYFTGTPRNLPAEKKWVFDHPFYLILNVAVGGEWPGTPEPATLFPQSMLVDYVRVYSRSDQK